VIKDRFFSLTMVLSVAFLLLVSLVISALLAAMGSFFSHTLPGGEAVWQILNTLIALGVTTVLFALIFKVVPDAEVRWKDVWVGALVTSILFGIGKTLLALYIGKSSVTSAFGAAGSMVAFVIWVYYSSQVLFLGAEFTRVYAQRFGERIRPDEDAEVVRDDAKPATANAQ
jgi:membrane protein